MADTPDNGDRPVAEASMDIDMDIDLGPEPELEPEVELIQAVGFPPAPLRLLCALYTNGFSWVIIRTPMFKASSSISLRKRRQFTKKSTCAAWMS